MRKDDYRGNVIHIPELVDVLDQDICINLGESHTIDDWPWGSRKRCTMKFSVETTKRGQRYVRQSTMAGRTYKPKKSTYADRVVLVSLFSKMGHIEYTKSYHMATLYIEDGSYSSTTFHDEEADQIADLFFSA